MNVVHVTHHYAPCVGGVETVVAEYAQRLSQGGVNTRIVCLNACPNAKKALPEKETIQGILVERIPFIDLKYYKIAPRVLQKIGDADIVHVHGLGFFSDSILATKFLHKKKVVVSTYGGFFHTPAFSLAKKMYFHSANRFLLGLADAVISIGANDTRVFSRIVRPETLRQIEIGADVEKLSRLSPDRKKNRLLFVGRLSANKNLEQLVRVFARVAEKFPNAKLVIAGNDFDGTQEKLEKMLPELQVREKVILTGALSEEQLYKEFSKADFFVSASRYESFGISAVEGMAAGLIPLLSPIPMFSSFVQHGKNGFLIDFGNEEKAAASLLNALKMREQEKRSMRKRAQEQAKMYSWENSYQKMLALYTSVLHD